MEVLRRPGVLLAVVACRRKFLRISGPYSPRVSAEGQEQVLPRPAFCILTRIQKPVLTVALRSHLVPSGSGPLFPGTRRAEQRASTTAVDRRLPLRLEKEERRGYHRGSLLQIVRTKSDLSVAGMAGHVGVAEERRVDLRFCGFVHHTGRAGLATPPALSDKGRIHDLVAHRPLRQARPHARDPAR